MSEPSGRVYLRAATAGDQVTIKRIVNDARLNPVHLDWPNFVVAVEVQDGEPSCQQIVATGQIKPHGDGSRELASIAVLPTHQRFGIAQAIIQTLLARECGPVYLYCADTMPAYYTRFGFVEVGAADLPPSIGRWFRGGRIAVSTMAKLVGEVHTLHAMRRLPD